MDSGISRAEIKAIRGPNRCLIKFDIYYPAFNNMLEYSGEMIANRMKL